MLRSTVWITALTILTAVTGWVSPTLDQGLVAHYTFNRCDARDDYGSSHGMLRGNVNCWCGVENDGLLFDGQSAYLEFGGEVNDYFGTSDFSISFYVKPEGGHSVFPISLLSKRADCSEQLLLDVMLDFQRGQVSTEVRESDYHYFRELSPALPTERGWVHFALVRSGQRARTYINGVAQQESFLCRGLDISNAAMLSFGNSPCVQGGRATRFRGVLDELRIYERALSTEEVKAIYDLTPILSASMDCAS